MNIFISHTSTDRDFAASLAGSLKERGFASFLSGTDIHAGSKWLDHLKEQVKRADGFVLVMPTVTAPSSNNAFFEVGVARALGKSVVVVVPDIEEVDQSNIPVDLADTVIVDAAKKPLKTVADAVAVAVKKWEAMETLIRKRGEGLVIDLPSEFVRETFLECRRCTQDCGGRQKRKDR
jgi:nucleoside 2-deoxyribosyltransferase